MADASVAIHRQAMAMNLDAISVDDDIALYQLKVDFELLGIAGEDRFQLALSDACQMPPLEPFIRSRVR